LAKHGLQRTELIWEFGANLSKLRKICAKTKVALQEQEVALEEQKVALQEQKSH
jgi:hypothetical protein